MAVFLASDGARMVSGQVMTVDAFTINQISWAVDIVPRPRSRPAGRPGLFAAREALAFLKDVQIHVIAHM